MNSLDSGDYLDQLHHNCGLVIAFYPNLSLFSVLFESRNFKFICSYFRLFRDFSF